MSTIEKSGCTVPLNHILCGEVAHTSRFHMPVVAPYLGKIPNDLIAFSRLMSKQKLPPQSACHFYIYDKKFERVWNRIEFYTNVLSKYDLVISPDFSVYSDMVIPEVMWNSYRNKIVTAYWQRNGISVIPNVSWSREWSYDFCFEGYPQHSVIAINSTGIRNDPRSTALWASGYRKAVECLKPIHIIRYGARQECEDSSISTYFVNDNKKEVGHGR